jgi:hypothetical protein
VPKRQEIRTPLGKMSVIDIPLRRVSVDIVGPLVPITDKGNRYILTLVDYTTQWCSDFLPLRHSSLAYVT